MPLKQIAHGRGEYIPDPVYLDSNVLISYFVPERRRNSVIRVIADLLSQRAKIVLSWVVYHELIWGLLEHTYANERKNREPEWSVSRMRIDDFNRHKEWLLPVAMGRLKKVPETLRAWRNVALFPCNQFGWEMSLSKLLETIMHHQLAPSDATHLTMAILCAKSIVTEDPDFQNLKQLNGDPNLLIYVV